MSDKGRDDLTMGLWLLFVGVPLYLLMEHPLIFWLVLVPLVIVFVWSFIRWLKK